MCDAWVVHDRLAQAVSMERLELLLVHLVREKREMNNMRVQIGGTATYTHYPTPTRVVYTKFTL